ncbi:MAG: restriction endonuclease subunit S [Lachnospiraceae bacterium]|nr:restriction endonuclease subunit S [Lachnospiraceae bacterium]
MGKPKIRFRGYTEDWEQRKLGDNIVEYTEKTTENNQYPVLTSSRKGIFFQTDYYYGNQIASADNTGYNIVPYGYFTYRHMSDDEIFHFNINDIAENGIVSTIYPVFTTDENLDSRYLQYQLNYGREFAKYAILQKQGGSRTYMYLNKLRNLYITVPTTTEEQKKISECFTNLDNLITLHQRKCEETKKLKKYMLQKMFPRNGQKVPEIRFSGFTEDWEQRKLGDVFKEYSEKNHTELPALTIIQGGGTVKREESDRNLMYDESNLSNYKMVRKGDFIVHLRSFEGGLEKSLLDGIISPAYHTFHSDVADSRFYYSYFRSHEFIKHKLVPHVYGIRDGRSIDIAGMKTIEIPYTSMEEQRKIGDYLEVLDNLVTLHQRKCDELQNIKKYMLQNMFV